MGIAGLANPSILLLYPRELICRSLNLTFFLP